MNIGTLRYYCISNISNHHKESIRQHSKYAGKAANPALHISKPDIFFTGSMQVYTVLARKRSTL